MLDECRNSYMESVPKDDEKKIFFSFYRKYMISLSPVGIYKCQFRQNLEFIKAISDLGLEKRWPQFKLTILLISKKKLHFLKSH